MMLPTSQICRQHDLSSSSSPLVIVLFQKGPKRLFNYPEENIEMTYHECDTFYAIRVNENEKAEAISTALRKFSQEMKISSILYSLDPNIE